MSPIWEAITVLFSFNGLFLATVGFLIGCVGGAMVGIGGALTTALVIPFTLSMTPADAMIILIGVYSGVSYAGSIPSILINTPGGPSSAAVTLDGYAMARRGEGATAIAISATASAFGALFGGLCLIVALPFLEYLAMAFGSPEFLMFGLFGLASIVAASDTGYLKGFTAGILGALLATIGASMLDANPRFTFGISDLVDGIDLVAVMIGLFAFSEMVRLSRNPNSISNSLAGLGSMWRGIVYAIREWKAIVRGSGMGILVGFVPGEGGTVATFMSYITEKQLSKEPERFGRGHPAGIAGPEAANNSVIGGSLVPTLSFGIPGSVSTALLLTALMLHGIRPGPTLFTNDVVILYTIIGSILFGAVLTMIVGLTMSRPLSLLTIIPIPILVPLVCVISVVGIYAASFNYSHIFVALAAGALGYAFIRLRYPVVAFLLGFIVGPLAEENFMRTWQITQGNLWEVLARPICAVLFLLTLIVMLRPLWRLLINKKWKKVSA
ncbi:tripartite tricarboxylate transporter permease [Aquamicrobium zhengzhouense]|uniref:Tripartite tricarboxylate transporter permease n=1 Tax=Aquamicrobium zhengzhouense TaxID=2781738 RepID=A0ABS0SHX5_9HYPH|nr:tripartite tricarboxylate transporter permease [Aquamicrobium zhengzhouense]MBI1622404.1 tripartite tricarboxylate transporter permease [Aquamicrobium zhengzhouense]